MTSHQPHPSIPWMKLFVLLILLGSLVSFFTLGGNQYINFSILKSNRNLLLTYTANHYWKMVALTVALYTVSTTLSLPIATILSLTTGFLFGRWVGTVIILFSATMGATLVFLAARYIFGEAAQRCMGLPAKKIMEGFRKNAFYYLLSLRLVPLFPFWLVNVTPAFTPIKVHTYILATAVGIVPATFIFSNLGESLGHIDSPDQLLSIKTMIALVLLGLFALAPVIIKKQRSKREDNA